MFLDTIVSPQYFVFDFETEEWILPPPGKKEGWESKSAFLKSGVFTNLGPAKGLRVMLNKFITQSIEKMADADQPPKSIELCNNQYTLFALSSHSNKPGANNRKRLELI